jgi:betaine-aldehyde dehydrogenase
VEAAFGSAHTAQQQWMQLTAVERAGAFHRIADEIEKHADALALLEARNSGNPVTAMRRDVLKGAELFRFTAGLTHLLKGETVPIQNSVLHFTKRTPWGVVARIVAFNHPFLFACGRVSTGLIAGNAVLLKPSELTPLSALALAEIAQDLLPPGLLAVLTGGPQLGAALVSHPRIERISFTGSVRTALKIIEQGAQSGHIKTGSYELGGKNAMIVFPDVNVDEVAQAAVRGMNFAAVQGQSCGSTSRLFVHESIASAVTRGIAERVSALKVGSPTSADSDMGCMITMAARDRAMGFITDAVDRGAVVEAGGASPEDPELSDGPYLLPTVLSNVPADARCATEEIFGPVLSIFTWSEWDDVIRRANGVPYGLTSSVWTQDVNNALRTADALEAGYAWVNDVEKRHYAIPFGGWKDSGVGVEYGIDEVLSLTRQKTYMINYSDGGTSSAEPMSPSTSRATREASRAAGTPQ